MTEFIPWSKQDRAIFSYFEQGTRITLFLCGIQAGKTTAAVHWLYLLTKLHRDQADNFIIASPTFRILEQSTLPPFLRLMDGLGVFNRQMMNFKIFGGGTVWMRTGMDPDSVVGITNVRGILCDEIGLFSRYYWDNLQARAAFKQAPIIGVSSPYAQNWLYTDYVRHLELNPKHFENDVVLIQARSDENPHFPRGEMERQRKLMDERRWRQLYGGEFGKMEGLVFDCWDNQENIIPELSLPVGTDIVAGIDWGCRHAFVIHVRAITKDGLHYQVSEFYKSGLNPLDMVAAARTIKLAWGVRVFYCDPSQPGMIDLFNKHGLTAVGAENDISMGIGFHYELIKTRRFKIFEGKCPYSVDQYATYHYPSPKDLKPDQDAKEIKPVKTNDDAMDAARYATAMTFHLSEGKRKVKQADGQTPMDRLSVPEQLKRLKRTARYESY